MLAQTETKSKASLGGRNGRTDKSEGSDPKLAKLKKDLSLALREISNLKNQLHQANENITRELAERGSKSRKDDSPDEEVGGKRPRQQAKRAKASRPATSSPSSPRKGFRMLPTGDNSDSEEEEDYPEPNARATYAHAKFARVLPPIQKKTSQLEVEPRPTRNFHCTQPPLERRPSSYSPHLKYVCRPPPIPSGRRGLIYDIRCGWRIPWSG